MSSDACRLGTLVAAAVAGLLLVFAGSEAHSQPAPSPPRTPAPAKPPVQGQALAAAQCAACHGLDGNSPDAQYPKIAGQKEFYLRLSLHAFKSGARKSDVMAAMTAGLSDPQIAELAHYYSEQEVKPDPIKNPQSAKAGGRVYHAAAGDAPACATCHSPRAPGTMGGPGVMGAPGMMGGPGMMGAPGTPGGPMARGMIPGGMGAINNTAAVPDLFGQHAGYTEQQLDDFASGKRRGTVMGPIAKAMSAHDREAVAEYLAGQR